MFKAWLSKNKVNGGFTFKARLYKFTSANEKLIKVSVMFKAWLSKITSVNIDKPTILRRFQIHLRRTSEQFPQRNKQQKAIVWTCEDEFDSLQ